MFGLRFGLDDEHDRDQLALESSEFVLLMCCKSIRRFHREFASMLNYIDGFQLSLVGHDVVRLPLGFRSMDCVIVGRSSTQRRKMLLVRVVLLVVHGFRHVFIEGYRDWTGSLCSRGVRSSPLRAV